MADINKIAEELGTLTILEAADLVKLLEEKWGVSAAAPVAAAGAAAAPGFMPGQAFLPLPFSDECCGRRSRKLIPRQSR